MATQARINSNLPPSINEIQATALQTLLNTYDGYIAERRNDYDIYSLNTLTLSSMLNMDVTMSSISSNNLSTLNSRISSLYSLELQAYQSSLSMLVQEEMSVIQAIYSLSNQIDIGSITDNNTYNTVVQFMNRLAELGYVVNTGQGSAQSGGQIYQLDPTSSQPVMYKSNPIHGGSIIHTDLSDPILRSTLSFSIGSGGLIGNAQNSYNIQMNSLQSITQAIQYTSSGTLITAGGTINTATTIAAINQAASDYNIASAQNYSSLLTSYTTECNNYLYNLYSLSTSLTLNLLENRNELENLNWALVNNSTNIIQSQIYRISTNSNAIRNFRPNIALFTTVIQAELYTKQHYLFVKRLKKIYI